MILLCADQKLALIEDNVVSKCTSVSLGSSLILTITIYQNFQSRNIRIKFTLLSVQLFHVTLTGELITSFSTSPCFLKISRRLG